MGILNVIQKLQFLQKLRWLHLQIFIGLCLLAWAGVGGALFGWKGALLAPLAGALLVALLLHCLLLTMVTIGLMAHRRGRHGVAMGCLWVAEVPRLRRYGRKGKVQEAFAKSKMQMMAAMMSGMMQNLGKR